MASGILDRLSPVGRIPGIDTARGLALFGMMATHVVPLVAGAAPSWAAVFAGRASALFALLAGFSVVLATRRVLEVPGPRGWAAAAGGLLVRGALIGVLGLVLGLLTSHIAVILVNYGVMFVLATVLLRAPTWFLGALAPVWFLVTPVVSHALRAEFSLVPGYGIPSALDLVRPVHLAQEILLTGYYPVLTWFGYLVAGMFLARLPWDRTLTRVLVLCFGGALALFAKATSHIVLGLGGSAELRRLTSMYPPYSRGSLEEAMEIGSYGVTPTDSWWWLTISGPHSGTPFDLLHTAGLAAAVVAACALVCSALGAREWVLAPLDAPGSMPLSVYCGHVVLVEITALLPLSDGTEYTVHVLVCMLGALAWKLGVNRRGALEWPLSLTVRGVQHRILGEKMVG